MTIFLQRAFQLFPRKRREMEKINFRIRFRKELNFLNYLLGSIIQELNGWLVDSVNPRLVKSKIAFIYKKR